MKTLERFKDLISVLPNTKENAVSMKDLARRLEMNTREVRQYVLEARKAGLCILSNENGYWLSEDAIEVERYVERRRNVAKTIFSYTQSMKKRRESHSEKK